MRTVTYATIAALSMALAIGCASNEYQVKPSEVSEMKPVGTTPAARCPMEIPGTIAQGLETNDGVAIVLTTPTGDVRELRSRARDLANALEARFAQLATRPAVTEADVDSREDLAEEALDRAEDRLDETEDEAEEAIDEYGDRVGDDAEDFAEERLDRAEDDAEQALDRAAETADAAEDRGEWQAERTEEGLPPAVAETRVVVEEIPTGARIHITPGEVSAMSSVRQLVWAEVYSMKAGRCPVMAPR